MPNFMKEVRKVIENYRQSHHECDILRARSGRLVCPICGALTKQRVLPSSRLYNFPLFCHRCKLTTVGVFEPEPLSLSR